MKMSPIFSCNTTETNDVKDVLSVPKAEEKMNEAVLGSSDNKKKKEGVKERSQDQETVAKQFIELYTNSSVSKNAKYYIPQRLTSSLSRLEKRE